MFLPSRRGKLKPGVKKKKKGGKSLCQDNHRLSKDCCLVGKERPGKFVLCFQLSRRSKGNSFVQGCDWSSPQMLNLERFSGWAGILGNFFLNNKRVRSWQNCGVWRTPGHKGML